MKTSTMLTYLRSSTGARVSAVIRPIRLIRKSSCVGVKRLLLFQSRLTFRPHLNGVTDVLLMTES